VKTSSKNAELVNTVLRKMMMIMFIAVKEMENANINHINREVRKISTGMNLEEAEIVADNIGTSLYYDVYSKALDDLLNSLPDCDYVGIERLVCLVEQLKRGGKNESSN